MKKAMIFVLCSILLLSSTACQTVKPHIEDTTVEQIHEQTAEETKEETKEETEKVTAVEMSTEKEKEPLMQPATPYYQEYDEFIEVWLRQQAKESGELGPNQTSKEYSLIVPVLHHPDYKFRLAKTFESGGYMIEYMPAHIEDPLDLTVYIDQDTITVKVKADALLHEEIIDMFLEDPNMVFDHELYLMHLVDVDFSDAKKMYAEDFDLSDYLTFEIRTYTITAETDAIQ